MNKTGIKIQFNNNYSTWTYSYNEIKDFSKNYIFYIKKGGDFYQEYSTFDYVFAKYANSSLSDKVTLTPSNDVLTKDIDNESSIIEATYVLYPSFAENFGTPLKWELAISPNSSGDYEVTAFQDYNGALVHGVSSNKGFHVNSVLAKNSFSFDLENMSFTVRPSFTRTLPAAAEGYATFSSIYDVIPDAGLTAQYASAVNKTTGKITWENYPATGIKAGEGALLTGTAGETYRFTPASSATAPTTNLLKAIPTKQQISGDNTYILSKPSTKVGFFKVNSAGSWCSAGTAYLAVPGTNSRDYFWIDDETTGIEAVNVNPETVKEDAREYYNLNGQRVMNPSKGLYIVNGKKVIIK